MTGKDLREAESAVRSLRNTLKCPLGYKDAARKQLADLEEGIAAVRVTTAPLREFVPYHAGARNIAADAARLLSEAECLVKRLDEQARYKGRTRSTMSQREVFAYIQRYGQASYLRLPW